MALKDIEKQIYQKDEQEVLDKERVQNTPYSVYAKHDSPDPVAFKNFQEADKTFLQKNKGKIFLFSLISLAILVGLISTGFFYQLNQQRFSDKRVKLEVKGQNQVRAGDEVNFTLVYTNDNLVALSNPKITVEVPDALIDSSLDILGQTKSSVREYELPELAPRSKGEIVIKGRLIGEQGSIHTIKSTLNYRPTILSSSFDTKNEFAVTVAETPVIIDIQTPLESVSGNEVNYTVTVNNKGDSELNNLELKLEYPDTFSFSSSNLPATGNEKDTFIISNLRAKGAFSVNIKGTLGGNEQDIKILKAQVGETRQGVFTLYANSQNSTKLSSPYVGIVQKVSPSSGIISSGEELEYTITFKNNTQVRIGQGSLRVQLDSNLLDLTKLRSQGADFDAGTNTLIWRANTLPQLKSFAPNEEGTISFTVPVKRTIPIDDFQDINYVIKTNATFESLEVPTALGVNKIVQGNSSEVKLATKLIPKISIYYKNPNSTIINTGPIPLKLAQSTTFTVNWEAQNLSNNVSGVTYRATLPANVSWTGQTSVTNGKLDYNERTKEVIWEVGDVPANTGLLRPIYRAIFQIAITPTPNQLGQEPRLLSRVNYTGKDTFTGLDLSGNFDIIVGGMQVSDIKGQIEVVE
ncbi:MAG: hypothetical protein RLZZ223_166 [Candidatus Parcubacteria bacterium]|jgi:hypothetical protein